jgi:putative transcriptional regulator
MFVYLIFSMAKVKVLHRLKDVLKEKGRSGYWLARETGITYNSINRYVNNKTEPSLTALFRIAEALKINPKDLINS